MCRKSRNSIILTTKYKRNGCREYFLSAAILFTGNIFQCIKELMDVINVSFISHTTFNKIQKKYLFLVIHRVYTTNRQLIIDNAIEKGDIDLLGDGSCDFLGCNAKYVAYTVLEKKLGSILDFNASHLRTAGNSERMDFRWPTTSIRVP